MGTHSLHLLLLPRTVRPSLPSATATPPSNSRRAPSGGACIVPRLRPRPRRAARPSVPAAVLADSTPRRAEDAPPPSSGEEQEQFDWLDQWYPLAPVCDLDPRAPHGRTVLGLSVVAWYDRGAGEWRVFDDACPHRLAPLSEGRVDDRGRLQCVYHGWCFDGAGACKFIPQAPALGPPVHKNSKACVASYPCVVQNKILWFFPRTEPEYKDVLQRKRPPYFPEIDDPSFVTMFGNRDLLYGYDVLIENLLDPAHVRYAHKGLMNVNRKIEDPGREEYDEERGIPIKMEMDRVNADGFTSLTQLGARPGSFRFIAPCTVYGSPTSKDADDEGNKKKKTPRFLLVTLCVPVSPGRSRVIWAFPRNVAVWMDKIVPRWFYHLNQNRILDSDIYLLHVEERKFAAAGLDKWQSYCYVPTSSDNMVIGFRTWFKKYCKNQIGWATPQPDQLPPPPPRDQLLERYWSHVVQCTSCSKALKALRALEVALQVASVAVVGFLAVANGTLLTSAVQRTAVVAAAVLCFVASRWLASFIEKNFYFQDFVHAYR